MTQRFALLFLGLAISLLVFLPTFMPLDAVVYAWIQTHRSCMLDRFAMALKQPPIIALIGMSVLVFAELGRQRRWSEARHAALVILLGALLCELLKAGFDRARPSVLPLSPHSRSFPSGHVTNAALLAGTLGFMLVRERWGRGVRLSGSLVLLIAVGVIAWQRLYVGHHWFTDVVGSLLLASAWLCFTLPRPAVFSTVRRMALAGMGVLVCLWGMQLFPQARVTLPSLISSHREPLLGVAFGELAPPKALNGSWGVHTREPAGPITWMRPGEASVMVQLPTGGQVETMRLAVRPFVEPREGVCRPLEVLVNQQPAGRLLLYRGWREYPLPLDPAYFVPGANVITFRIRPDAAAANSDQRAVAFLYLHLFAETR